VGCNPLIIELFQFKYWVKTGFKFIVKSFAGMASLNFAILIQEMPSLFWIQFLMLLESSHFIFYFEYLRVKGLHLINGKNQLFYVNALCGMQSLVY